MSTNITGGVAGDAGFVPTVWAQNALDVLRGNIVLAKRVARDYKFNDQQSQGKTINIPYPGRFTARKKAANTPATTQVPQGGQFFPVTLSEHIYVDFIVEDVAEAQANAPLMQRYIKPAMIAIAEGIETDLWTVVDEFTNEIGVPGTDIGKATVIAAREGLNTLKNPQTDRTLVISDKDEAALLGDSTLAQYFANARPEGVAEGSIGRLYGFDIFPSQLVPVTDDETPVTKNLAFHEDAIVLATRPFKGIPEGAGAGAQAYTQVDEDSGLLIRVIYQYSIGDRGARVGFDMLYGFAKLRDEAALRVNS
ncbi:MAG TPA: P22 phage major capsid protein family protein [Pyrinomonadaceae bacterium]|nr:P22 phage major capsid protein family protein [Pyrinomonadaceae bacterium]